MPKTFTIVGIDPGTTVGISVLDLNGNLILTMSSKDMSVNDIIEKILDSGIPSIVATDVSSAPQTVEKIAVSMGAKLFYPAASISVREKNEIAKMYPSVKNAHERDSLSAALKAYQYYVNKFENIDSRLRELGLMGISGEVKTMVVKGHSVNSAIDLLTYERSAAGDKGVAREERPKRMVDDKDLSIQELQIRISNQRSYIDDLSKQMAAQRREINRLRSNIEQYDMDAAINAKRSKGVMSKNKVIKKQQVQILELKERNAQLEKTLDETREIRSLDLNEKVMVCKYLAQYTKSAILELDGRFRIRKGDIIYINDCSGGGTATSQLLCEKEIKAVIYCKGMSHSAKSLLEKCEVALINNEKVPVKVHEDLAIVDRDAFEREYVSWKEYNRMNKKKEVHDWLDGMISQYRYERRKKTK